MSYSDEPNVISEQKRSKKVYFFIGALILFIALLASVAFFPRIIEFQRRNTPTGPNQGSLYFISFEKNRYSMELVRSEEYDFYMGALIQPARDKTPWEPGEYQVGLRMEGEGDFERLDWNPEAGLFGPSQLRLHPSTDVRVDLEVYREDKTVWSGTRWSFRPGGGHGH